MIKVILGYLEHLSECQRAATCCLVI